VRICSTVSVFEIHSKRHPSPNPGQPYQLVVVAETPLVQDGQEHRDHAAVHTRTHAGSSAQVAHDADSHPVRKRRANGHGRAALVYGTRACDGGVAAARCCATDDGDARHISTHNVAGTQPFASEITERLRTHRVQVTRRLSSKARARNCMSQSAAHGVKELTVRTPSKRSRRRSPSST
jgi:hypothetical protein